MHSVKFVREIVRASAAGHFRNSASRMPATSAGPAPPPPHECFDAAGEVPAWAHDFEDELVTLLHAFESRIVRSVKSVEQKCHGLQAEVSTLLPTGNRTGTPEEEEKVAAGGPEYTIDYGTPMAEEKAARRGVEAPSLEQIMLQVQDAIRQDRAKHADEADQKFSRLGDLISGVEGSQLELKLRVDAGRVGREEGPAGAKQVQLEVDALAGRLERLETSVRTNGVQHGRQLEALGGRAEVLEARGASWRLG